MLLRSDDSSFRSAPLPSHHVHHEDAFGRVQIKKPFHFEISSAIHALHIEGVNELESKLIEFDLLIYLQVTIKNDSLSLSYRVSRVILT